MQNVYLLHPQERYLPGITDWVSGVGKLIGADAKWDGWQIQAVSFDSQNGFSASDVTARVVASLGPVVVAGAVQASACQILRDRLQTRSVVVVADKIGCEADLLAALQDARQRFESGEPQLPRKFVVAVLVLRKMISCDYWGGGAKNKAFAWLDNIAKGRGVDDQFADIVPEVVNDLCLHDLLVKKISNGGKKYGLNHELRAEVHLAADSLVFANEALRRLLMKDRRLVSARWLDK